MWLHRMLAVRPTHPDQPSAGWGGTYSRPRPLKNYRNRYGCLNLSGIFGGRGVIPDAKVGEVIAYVLVASVLFVDLENPSVLNVVGRENMRFLALQKKGGV